MTDPRPLHDRMVGALAHQDLSCERCGFSLRGLPEPTCPECGAPVRAGYALSGPHAADHRALRPRAERQFVFALAVLFGRLIACGAVTAVGARAPGAGAVLARLACPGLLLFDLVAVAVAAAAVNAVGGSAPRDAAHLTRHRARVDNARAVLIAVWVLHGVLLGVERLLWP